MGTLRFQTALSSEERQEKRRLIVRDAATLASLFGIAVALSVLTWFFFHSFERHREELSLRWLARGRAEMQRGNPAPAVNALRSALALSPGNHEMEVELATALAAAGKTDEAISYFSTLWEAAPGDGMINLQLARLAARKKNEKAEAVQYYLSALDGTWQGDGYTRRREVRLEMARYLIAQHDFERARAQLLIAAGNAPDEPAVKLEIAALLEQAEDAQSAFDLYRGMSAKHPAPVAALEGAGHTAWALSRFAEAHGYLQRAVGHADFDRLPDSEQSATRDLLGTASRLLSLDPASERSMRGRAERVLHDEKIASARLTVCAQQAPSAANIAGLTARWQKLPAKRNVAPLEQQPELEESVMQLVFDTEQAANAACGAPSGDDALLLKMAQAAGTSSEP